MSAHLRSTLTTHWDVSSDHNTGAPSCNSPLAGKNKLNTSRFLNNFALFAIFEIAMKCFNDIVLFYAFLLACTCWRIGCLAGATSLSSWSTTYGRVALLVRMVCCVLQAFEHVHDVVCKAIIIVLVRILVESIMSDQTTLIACPGFNTLQFQP